jgi:8-oxo-dGTP pyrophosphatase MutT (NUDIX family)
MIDPSRLTTDKIRWALKQYQSLATPTEYRLRLQVELGALQPAAVLMPLFKMDQEWHLLLTQRSQNLVQHRGQVAFPGGAHESGDADLEATALREMDEEIGLSTGDVEVLGHLGDIPAVTGFMVRIFVGQIPWPYPLTVNSKEVESVFSIPLAWLAEPRNRSLQYREYAGQRLPVVYYDLYQGRQLWGLSADMTIALLDALALIC